jgi:aminopeptidase N
MLQKLPARIPDLNPRNLAILFFVLLGCAIFIMPRVVPSAGHSERPVREIVLTIDPQTGDFEVTQRLSDSQETIRFAASDWITVEKVESGGEIIKPDGTAPVYNIDIPGSATASPVVIELSGKLPPQSDRIQAGSVNPDGGYLLGGAEWLASPDSAKTVYRITLDVPESYTALATGSFISEREENGRYRATFEHSDSGDEIGIFFGPYEIDERIEEGYRIRTYFRHQDADRSSAFLDASERYLQRYSKLIGEYPYESFAIVSAPLPVGLGFAGMTYVSQDILEHDYMLGRSLAHEVLHNWWGNAVAVDYDKGNWAEGLTTYQADYSLAEEQGGETATRMRREWLQALSALPQDKQETARQFRSAAHSRGQSIGYGKIAMMFHMLEQVIGKEAFSAAIEDFWREERSRMADWSDLQSAFETASDRDLKWFFNQWLDRKGLPKLELGQTDVAGISNGWRLRYELGQTRPSYRLNVPVTISTSTGNTKVIAELNDEQDIFYAVVPDRPERIHVDPGFEIARTLLDGELAPTIGEAFSGLETVVPAAAEETFRGTALAFAGKLLRGSLETREPQELADLEKHSLIIGETEAVLSLRNKTSSEPAPDIARRGTARAWVEKEPGGRLRLYVSADDASQLGGRLAGLRYFGNRSYLALSGEKTVAIGTWPVTDSPLTRELEPEQQ